MHARQVLLKPGMFYRGASPVNNKRNRAAYANALIADAGVRVDFDLADNEGEIEEFLEEDAEAGVDVSYFKGLRSAPNPSGPPISRMSGARALRPHSSSAGGKLSL